MSQVKLYTRKKGGGVREIKSGELSSTDLLDLAPGPLGMMGKAAGMAGRAAGKTARGVVRAAPRGLSAAEARAMKASDKVMRNSLKKTAKGAAKAKSRFNRGINEREVFDQGVKAQVRKIEKEYGPRLKKKPPAPPPKKTAQGGPKVPPGYYWTPGTGPEKGGLIKKITPNMKTWKTKGK